ncbi:hypothetical protein ID866_5615 [Astraeus odoratus]|nr:hypothetical protein ID866_5615 [Astraeus odoratus]
MFSRRAWNQFHHCCDSKLAHGYRRRYDDDCCDHIRCHYRYSLLQVFHPTTEDGHAKDVPTSLL